MHFVIRLMSEFCEKRSWPLPQTELLLTGGKQSFRDCCPEESCAFRSDAITVASDALTAVVSILSQLEL